MNTFYKIIICAIFIIPAASFGFLINGAFGALLGIFSGVILNAIFARSILVLNKQ